MIKQHLIRVIILSSAIFPSLLSAKLESSLNLNDLFRIASENNTVLIGLRYDIDQAVINRQLIATRFFSDPVFTGTFKKTSNQNNWSSEFSLNQPFELAGQREIRLHQAGLSVIRAEMNLRKNQFSLNEKIKSLFFEITALAEKEKKLLRIIEIETQLEDLIALQQKQGEISTIEGNTFTLELWQTKNKLLTIKKSKTQKIAELEKMAGVLLSPDNPVHYQWEDFDESAAIESKASQLYENNHDLRLASVNIALADDQVILLRTGLGIPEVNVSGILGSEGSDSLFGGEFSFPFPVTGQRKGPVMIAKNRLRKLETERKQLKKITAIDWWNKLESLKILNQEKENYEKRILPLLDQNFAEMTDRYRKGLVGLSTLEKNIQWLIEAQISYIDLQLEYVQTILAIEQLLGLDLNREDN